MHYMYVGGKKFAMVMGVFVCRREFLKPGVCERGGDWILSIVRNKVW